MMFLFLGVPMKKNCVELGKCSNELTQQKQPPPIPPKPFKSSQRLNPTFDINYQRQQSSIILNNLIPIPVNNSEISPFSTWFLYLNNLRIGVVPQQEDPQAENGDYEVPICDPNMDSKNDTVPWFFK